MFSKNPEIMVFQPTMEEFKNFPEYIKKMESYGAHHMGLAKVIPPAEWKARSGTYDMAEIGDMMIPTPVKQSRSGQQGIYQQTNEARDSMTLKKFKKLAESPKYCSSRPPLGDHSEVERAFWKNLTYGKQIYGADVSGSLMDCEQWNMNSLGSILDWLGDGYEGVTSPYLYFGMWKTAFAWHTEDMDLYSLSYLHFGAPKTWYAIPPSHGRRFERFTSGLFPDDAKLCKSIFRHKFSLISPSVLRNNSIPVNSVSQEAGEFIVTFPFGYHAGFNQGFNCAEAVNFALERWVEFGKRCTLCTCTDNIIQFPMDEFERRLQHKNWLRHEDVVEHEEEPAKKKLATFPEDRDRVS